MSAFPYTRRALSDLVKSYRALLAQELLAWALKLDSHEVMTTVACGVAEGEKRAGKAPGTYARKYAQP